MARSRKQGASPRALSGALRPDPSLYRVHGVVAPTPRRRRHVDAGEPRKKEPSELLRPKALDRLSRP
jgi:hypothetical protein